MTYLARWTVPGDKQRQQFRTPATDHASTGRSGEPVRFPHRQGGVQDQGDQRSDGRLHTGRLRNAA